MTVQIGLVRLLRSQILGVYSSDAQQAAGAVIDVPKMARLFQMHTSWFQNEQLFKLWMDESSLRAVTGISGSMPQRKSFFVVKDTSTTAR